ncbi:hypothetical protein Ahy_A05g025661 isoform C [Arachis hypogaea]|uniref:Uncharacterized protein n=1 Tax=Arachis hypogaea TaxID=3818 RepID=A0A445D981_ARAHY|nr:hypothetical protein Ahy_A05g025661 isoform C [Arachis hypogaea]
MEMVGEGAVRDVVVDQKQPFWVTAVAMELHEVGVVYAREDEDLVAEGLGGERFSGSGVVVLVEMFHGDESPVAELAEVDGAEPAVADLALGVKSIRGGLKLLVGEYRREEAACGQRNSEGQHSGSVGLDELALGDPRRRDGGLRMEADEVLVGVGSIESAEASALFAAGEVGSESEAERCIDPQSGRSRFGFLMRLHCQEQRLQFVGGEHGWRKNRRAHEASRTLKGEAERLMGWLGMERKWVEGHDVRMEKVRLLMEMKEWGVEQRSWKEGWPQPGEEENGNGKGRVEANGGHGVFVDEQAMWEVDGVQKKLKKKKR